jgi:CotH kinase protein/Lamin Tail Domain
MQVEFKWHRPILVLLAQLLITIRTSFASVIINEIAPKGTSHFCAGQDWIELYNNGSEAVDLSSNYILFDDRGDAGDPFRFTSFSPIEAQSYLVLCTNVKNWNGIADATDPRSPQFGIGKEDTITLIKLLDSENLTSVVVGRSFSFEIISSVGPLPGIEEAIDMTYALDPNTPNRYNYTSTPTPGASNVMTDDVATQEERAEADRARLAVQNNLGTTFFNMDDQGLPVADGMPDVLDFHLAMNEVDFDYITLNASHELYRPFDGARILTADGEEIANFANPGRIRPKGQSTLYISQCIGTSTIPFQIDMGTNQTLFGVQRLYLRHHMEDNSYMRDWAYHRMLARFGLPHLRSRHVRFFINGQLMGFYILLEAADQEFVFARNFPGYAPGGKPAALYKITNLGVTCGEYSQEQIASATLRKGETSTPPYAFERGEHRLPVEVLGLLKGQQCAHNYLRDTEVRDKEDVILAWLRYNKDCAKMRMDEGLVDRQFGSSDLDDVMENFLRAHLDLSLDHCDPSCANSDLKDDVDVENFLKTLAFYAVTLNMDSPLGAGFNHFFVQAGDGRGWKLQAYGTSSQVFPESVFLLLCCRLHVFSNFTPKTLTILTQTSASQRFALKG